MPLTRRQFELGIDEETDHWMRRIYLLLAGNRELAYLSGELYQALFGSSNPKYTEVGKFQRALDVLVELSAVEKRQVKSLDYYAFLEEFDITSWEREGTRV